MTYVYRSIIGRLTGVEERVPLLALAMEWVVLVGFAALVAAMIAGLAAGLVIVAHG